MAPSTDPDIDSLTYPHDDLRSKFYHLDRLLDRMPPIFSIDDSVPLNRQLGALAVFPDDILYDVFSHLSIIDLMRLRRCNRFASHFINTIPLLRKILRIAPNTIKGIMAIQVSERITLEQLCQKLYQRECDGCGELAQSIYLPTCHRACFDCMHPQGGGNFNAALTYDQLYGDYSVSSERIATWPSFLPPHCTFTNGVNKFKTAERHVLYSSYSYTFGQKLGWDTTWQYSFRGAITGPEVDRSWDMARRDPNREAVTVVQGPLNMMLREHMTVVIAPWPDSTGLNVEHGILCSTCLGTSRQDRIFSRDTFLEHLKDCRVRPSSMRFFIKPRDWGLWVCED